MDERLQLHPLADQNAVEALLRDVTGGSRDSRLCPQLLSIARHLSLMGAAVAVSQRAVQDPDFLAEHAAYYTHWAFPVPRYCIRIHFFAGSLGSTDVLEAIDFYAAQPDNRYVGFVTLRPIVQNPVGATFLKKPTRDGQRFVRTFDKYPVNLTGRRFHVDATPFMQQDNAVGACAQASIWMALRTRRWKEGRSACSPAEITSAATRFVVNGRTLPNRDGLRIEQITEAIRTAGYSPHVLNLRSPESLNDKRWKPGEYQKICRALYPYVESGIPVLLALMHRTGGHAVVVVGHAWNEQPARETAERLCPDGPQLHDASDWAQPFIIHNDNSGPYLDLPAGPEQDYSLEDAVCAIPLLSGDILVDAEEARTASSRILRELFAHPDLKKLLDFPDALVTRTRLLARSAFREDIMNSATTTDYLRRYYRTKWLPGHVWIFELHSAIQYGKSPENGLFRLGEVVLDPSADPIEGHFLTIRLNGALLREHGPQIDLVIDRGADTGHIELRLLGQ